MNPIFYILIICAVIVCAVIFYRVWQKKYDEFVAKNSVCLKRLEEINARYKFAPYENFDQRHAYDNENFYNSVSCEDYLIYQLQFIGVKVSRQIDRAKENALKYKAYQSEIKAITQFGQFACPTGKLKVEKLTALESKLFNRRIYTSKVTNFSINVKLIRTTVNGKYVAAKSDSFAAERISALLFRLRNKKGNFYNDRGIWDAICRVERGKVSNKMRFSILKRDGYRCKRCGVSERLAALEIDHIMPIAKGGKTTYDNLQTLCHRCNVLKGDTYKKY